MNGAEKPPRATGADMPDIKRRSQGRNGHRWRRTFLAHLAETSSVAEAAAAAGIDTAKAYRLRREDRRFAQSWSEALLEGYEHLELETLRRLRMGVEKEDPKFDIANALRLLAFHRDSVARERARAQHLDEESILASLEAKLSRIRERDAGIMRRLEADGVIVSPIAARS